MWAIRWRDISSACTVVTCVNDPPTNERIIVPANNPMNYKRRKFEDKNPKSNWFEIVQYKLTDTAQ